MAVKKELFHEWKTHPVTDELKRELRETLEILVGQMVSRMEPDPARDGFTRAFARAVDVVLSWQPDIITEEADAED
jgi:hypothetical protein